MSSEVSEIDNDKNKFSYWDIFNRWTLLLIIIWGIAYHMGTNDGTTKFKRDILGIKPRIRTSAGSSGSSGSWGLSGASFNFFN